MWFNRVFFYCRGNLIAMWAWIGNKVYDTKECKCTIISVKSINKSSIRRQDKLSLQYTHLNVTIFQQIIEQAICSSFKCRASKLNRMEIWRHFCRNFFDHKRYCITFFQVTVFKPREVMPIEIGLDSLKYILIDDIQRQHFLFKPKC